MASAMRVFRKFRSSDGRIKVATLSGVSALVAAIALLVGVLPAIAGSGEPSGLGVQPTEISYGGGSGACDAEFPGLPSDGGTELWINNPMSDVYEGPDGTKVKITVDDADAFFDFEFVNNPTKAAYDVVVNGGSQNTHYDYDASVVGPVRADTDLHAPTKGGGSKLFSLSHINICYGDFVPNVAGTKYHDRDADGTLDVTEEEGLSGWKIAAFDSTTGDLVRQAVTGADGSYVLGNLGEGTYFICEATNTTGLPDAGDNFAWAWTQSAPLNEDCTTSGYEPGGHTITVDSETPLASDVDFGNHRQVSVTCDPDNDVVVTLDGESDEPAASVTFPAGCQSGIGDNPPYTTSFDLGLSEDGDNWDQFVVFGGDPASTQVLTQTIEWAPEDAVYNNDNELIVDTTKVLLDLTGPVPDPLPDVTFCHDIDGGDPTEATPQCLDSRLIAEGGDVPVDHIQITEHYKLLGDPGNFR